MATPLGTSFSTDEKIMVQADVKFLGSTVDLSLSSLTKRNLKNFSLWVPKFPRQCSNTAKSLRGLALKSL